MVRSWGCAGGDGVLQESSSDGHVQKHRGGVGAAAGGEGVEKTCRGRPEEDRTRSVGENNAIVAVPLDAVSTAVLEAGLGGRGGERARQVLS